VSHSIPHEQEQMWQIWRPPSLSACGDNEELIGLPVAPSDDGDPGAPTISNTMAASSGGCNQLSFEKQADSNRVPYISCKNVKQGFW